MPESVEKPKHILIVEDDDDGRELLERMLRNAGHSTEQARDGMEAMLAILDAVKGMRPLPDLVLLDVRMPRMNGLDFYKLLQSVRPIPVLLLSGEESLRTAEGYAEIADLPRPACLSKPYTHETLLDAVRSLLP